MTVASFLKKFSSKNGVQAVGKGSSGCRRGLGSRDSLIIIASSMTFVNRFLQVFLIFSTKFEGEVWARCILGRRRLAGTNYGGGRQEGCGIRWFWGMGERWKIDGSRREVAGRACPAPTGEWKGERVPAGNGQAEGSRPLPTMRKIRGWLWKSARAGHARPLRG